MKDITALFDEVHATLDEMEELASNREQRLDALQKDTTNARKELDKVNESIKSNALELNKVQEEYRVKVAALEKEKQRLSGEVDALIAQKGQLRADNLKLESKNNSFVEYEKKAREALANKEDVLIAREKALDRQEALRPRKRSILPDEDE